MQVSGGEFYEVDAFLTYRITDPRLFRERALGELRSAEDRIAHPLRRRAAPGLRSA